MFQALQLLRQKDNRISELESELAELRSYTDSLVGGQPNIQLQETLRRVEKDNDDLRHQVDSLSNQLVAKNEEVNRVKAKCDEDLAQWREKCLDYSEQIEVTKPPRPIPPHATRINLIELILCRLFVVCVCIHVYVHVSGPHRRIS